MTITGYTTINNEWGILIDKDLAKHDLLLRIYTTKGECDWDPNFGTTIKNKLFQPKTIQVRNDIQNELIETFLEDPRFTLLSIEPVDIDKGWVFYCSISYLDGIPEEWQLDITLDKFNNPSNGYFPLGVN
nr:MAG TPA: baseplate wedge protein [Caudoviricetes sp.]